MPNITSIGEYHVERSLGAGLLGEVYLCKTEGDVIHALKVVDPRRGRRLKFSQRFIREFANPLLGQYLDIHFEEGIGHIFRMDYLDVMPISRQALRRTLSREVLEMFAQVAEALAGVHEKGVLHGNIKRSNFLLRRAGPGKRHPILGDFGIGYVYDPKGPFEGLVKDAMACMAPERIRALVELPDDEDGQWKRLTPAADLYSLTCVLVEALTGKDVYRESDTVEGKLKEKDDVRYMLLNVNYPSLQVNIGKLNEFIARNLAVNPKERDQDGKSYAAALRECIAREPEYKVQLRQAGG
ncbi:MAG: protein kinase [Planctomycetota bacterium]|nr:protein kinase [Planctomycetota bacterium]